MAPPVAPPSGLFTYASALLAASTQRDIADAFSSAGVDAANAQAGEIYLAAEPGSLRLLTTGAAEDAVVQCRVVSTSAPVPSAEAFRNGEPLWLGTVSELEARFPSIKDFASATGQCACAAIPLFHGERPMGVIALEFGSEQEFDEGQRVVLSAVADLTARALSRAYRDEEQRGARSFQHRLIGIAGHELRNPLTVVIAVSEQLGRTAAADAEKRAAGRLLRNARRMERVVRDLVDYAHAEAEGGLHVAPRPLDFHDLCVRVVSALASLHPERTITYQRGEDGRGIWDADRLEELLENLLINALKYGAADEPVHLEWRGDGEELEVLVHNDGPPISPSLLPHVFDPFERGEKQATRDSLGLGLYIVKQIVTAHRGRVEVRSSYDDGTTIAVRLPRALPSAAAGDLTA
jgi:signal transduction histidine kinase